VKVENRARYDGKGESGAPGHRRLASGAGISVVLVARDVSGSAVELRRPTAAGI
jgi:hypothetical protein